MKKMLVMVILLLTSIGLWADGYVEAGYVPTMQVWDFVEDYSTHLEDELYYAKINADVDITDYFVIGGWIKTYIAKTSDGYTFHPFYLDYNFHTAVKYDKYELGFRHWCSHPQNLLEGISDPIVSTNRAYEEVYIKVTF